MEYALRQIPNDYSYKREYLDANSNKINTLILGDSHSFYGLDPIYFTTNTFNASHPSQSLDFDVKILKKYENKFNSLHTIVIPISYFLLYNNLATGLESWRVKNYVLYYAMNTARSYKDYFEILGNNFNLNLVRLVLYYIKGNRSFRCLNCTTLGRVKDYIDPQDLLKVGKRSAQEQTKDIYSDKNVIVFKANVLTLNSIITWSRKKNVKVVLFTPPAYGTYRHYLNPEQLRIAVDSAREIASKNENCIYVNLLNDTTFVASDFYDAHHLSEAGAKKLSMLINDIINNGK